VAISQKIESGQSRKSFLFLGDRKRVMALLGLRMPMPMDGDIADMKTIKRKKENWSLWCDDWLN
jgi:hypothetical protein